MDPITVYVVDDDDDVRRALTFLLGTRGHPCRSYPTAKMFIAELATLEPGCILLDFNLGGLTGLQLLAELRRTAIYWPVIVMTGHGQAGIVEMARRLGALGCLGKPFDDRQLDELLAQARDMLAGDAEDSRVA